MSTPDSARLALPRDADAIAALQAEALRDRHGSSLQVPETIRDSWLAAIARPPLAQFRVLVATSQQGVVGFAATAPAADPDAAPTDGEVAEFVADGDHADRLMHAVVDTLVADGFTAARWWVASDDDERRRWLESSGWAPDGAHQSLGDDSGQHTVKLVRLQTRIADAPTTQPSE